MKRHAAANVALMISLLFSVFSIKAADFWQDDWVAPQRAENNRLLLRPIQVADTERLFHSYMGSQAYLYQRLGWSWPTEKSSLEQNQSMVQFHLKQRENNSAFTYVVIDRERDMLIGAIYFVPVTAERGQTGAIQSDSFNAEITWWLTEPAINQNLHNDLFEILTQWLKTSWPWQQVLFPVANSNRNAMGLLESSSARFVGENRDTNERFYSYTLARK